LSVDKDKATEILDFQNKIQESIKVNQKPEFAIKSLLYIAEGV